jgi:hypothetical protein
MSTTLPLTRRPCLSVAAALTLLSLMACSSAPTGKDVASYVSAPLADAEVMPVINEDRENTKVVVVDGADGSQALARQAQLGKQLTKAVEQTLGGRNIEIVDDALAPTLDESLRKAEALSTSAGASYAGPKVAKFAIKPAVLNSSYSAVYHAATGAVGATLLAKLAASPAGYEHRASVAAVVRVYELPTLRLVGAVNAEGSASVTDAAQAANATTGTALLSEAAADAIRSATPELLNLFSSKGFIVQRRIHSEHKTSAFQISMGRVDGLAPGDRVEIYTLRPNDHAMLKSAPAHEEVPVGSGIVTTMQFTDASAWIVLDEESDAPKVHRGDVVKQKHRPKTVWDKMVDKASRMAP